MNLHEQNKAKIKPCTKIRILSPEHSKYVQELAFEAGAEWLPIGKEPKYLDKRFLYIDEHMGLTHGQEEMTFNLSDRMEIQIDIAPTPNEINARVLAEKTGSKYDQGKPRYDLIPVHAEAEFVDVLTFGADKYGANNWRNVPDSKTRYQAALGRHVAAYRMGETHDIESGKHHLAHAMCCLSFLLEMELEGEA